jgi:hypothetical protein
MIIAVAGSRSITNGEFIFDCIKDITTNDIVLVGNAQGVDSIVKEICDSKGIVCIVFRPANYYYREIYNKLGRYEGNRLYYARDLNVLEEADKCIAIWDGKSGGTKFFINACQDMEKPLVINKL